MSQFYRHWYDRQSRNWITQIIDPTGNQIGDALYAGNPESAASNKASAIKAVREATRIDVAANNFEASIKDQPWFHALGIGQMKGIETLFLYYRGHKPKKIAKEWQGYDVVARPARRLVTD